jgi:hypothetical protein
MITLAWKAITSLVVSFGLSAWSGVKKGETPSSVRIRAPTRISPRFGSASSPASRWRRSWPGGLRLRKF